MAAEEEFGVMVAAMIQQEGAMQEVSVWESEVEGAMREMEKMVEGEDSYL